MKLNRQYFECSCYSPDHLLVLDRDEEENEFSITFRLKNWRSLWSRICLAFKYVFKIGDCADHFNAWILRPEDVDRFKTFLATGVNPCESVTYTSLEEIDDAINEIYIKEEQLELQHEHLLNCREKLEFNLIKERSNSNNTINDDDEEEY